jgi:transposase
MARRRKTNRRELSPTKRAYLVGRRDAGESFGQISSKTGIPKSTVIDTVKNASERGTTKSLPRGGPRKTDPRDDRILCREAKKDFQARRVPLAQLQANIQPHLCRSTIQHCLKEKNIRKWIAKGCPRLKEEHKVARYNWVCEHQYWEIKDWEKVLWSDECMVERKSGKGPVWVFRTPQEKWDQDCIEPHGDIKKDIKVMFWGCFGGRAMMRLTDLKGDSESKGGGIIECIILESTLKTILPQILDDHPDLIFMQDGAKVYKGRELLAWLEEKGYKVIVWPLYSLDLNPIEYVWAELKKLVYKLHPELYSIKGSENAMIEKIKVVIYEAWEQISDEFLYNFIDSMHEQVKAVRKAREGYI